MLSKHHWWQIIVAFTVKIYRSACVMFEISGAVQYHYLKLRQS